MRWARLRLWLAAILMTGWSMTVLPDATSCSESFFGGRTKTCKNEIGWRYDREQRAFTSGGMPSSVTTNSVRYHYVYRSRCEAGVNCMAARSCGPVGYRYNVDIYVVRSDGSYGPDPDRLDTVCVYPDVTVPVATVTAGAHEELRKRIPAPSVASAPPGKTLVNIVTIYHTAAQSPQRIDITTPVPGSITATPEYRWDFGDGQAATGPGLAYQSPDDPNALPGKYLGPVWRTPGVKHVTLTVTWTVRFQMAGEDISLEPIVFTATEDKTVATARAVLVNR